MGDHCRMWVILLVQESLKEIKKLSVTKNKIQTPHLFNKTLSNSVSGLLSYIFLGLFLQLTWRLSDCPWVSQTPSCLRAFAPVIHITLMFFPNLCMWLMFTLLNCHFCRKPFLDQKKKKIAPVLLTIHLSFVNVCIYTCMYMYTHKLHLSPSDVISVFINS